MTGFEFGDVVLVAFPFTDHQATRQRPAVVVSSTAYHRARPDVIIMAITSQVRCQSVGEARLRQWQQAGLLGPSMLKPVVATIERRMIRRRLGGLVPEDALSLRRALGEIIGM